MRDVDGESVHMHPERARSAWNRRVATRPAAPRQEIGIDGSKFAMHGAVTSTTPPAAPVAVTDAMVEASIVAARAVDAKNDETCGEYIRRMHRAGLAAALAAAASAARGGKA